MDNTLNEGYLTVKDFADAVGKTTQYIYRITKTKLQQFVKKENGITLISAEALSQFAEMEETEKYANNQLEDSDLLQQLLSEKTEYIDQLKTELLTQNNHIKQLTDLLSTLINKI